MDLTSEAVTRGIRVRVSSAYDPSRSSPERSQWFFTYRVRIANEGREIVQLVSRHWVITDAQGRTEEVRGPGVVGEQPRLGPGEHFEYVSGCPLPTPFGSMQSSYRMVTSSGESFDARIAPFPLNEPHSIH